MLYEKVCDNIFGFTMSFNICLEGSQYLVKCFFFTAGAASAAAPAAYIIVVVLVVDICVFLSSFVPHICWFG